MASELDRMIDRSTMTGSIARYESKADYIARNLRHQIVSGAIEPGADLRQRELAERFQVSATPVREALSRLQAEGFVTVRLHQGATVVREVGERRQENWRIRERLESLAAEMAAERLTDDDLAEIHALAQKFESAKTPQESQDFNQAFHFRIYEAARSPVLLRFIEELWRALDVEPSAYRSHEDSVNEHFAIVEALQSHDLKAAAELTGDHIAATATKAQQLEVEPKVPMSAGSYAPDPD